MDQVAVIEIGRDSLFQILIISAPLMIAGMVVGIVISLFQALTTIQEMTLTFVPKIIAVFIATVVFLPFMMTSLIEFSHGLFDRIAAIG
ncbi:MAG: flagellar biosynthetic protein FliQ [Rhodospirillales bacterium RIFCSPLOWO2_12_FULL_67_15]|nr:MAG: flagellar biosynthetic protein FliQ [Rhodospirillales bacterium RIFCSPLOWO2_12_FULL_67_15]